MRGEGNSSPEQREDREMASIGIQRKPHTYGTVKVFGWGTAYKVGRSDISYFARKGWLLVGNGTSYAYMIKPQS